MFVVGGDHRLKQHVELGDDRRQQLSHQLQFFLQRATLPGGLTRNELGTVAGTGAWENAPLTKHADKNQCTCFIYVVLTPTKLFRIHSATVALNCALNGACFSSTQTHANTQRKPGADLWRELALHDEDARRLVHEQLVLVAELRVRGACAVARPVVGRVEREQVVQPLQDVLEERVQVRSAGHSQTRAAQQQNRQSVRQII